MTGWAPVRQKGSLVSPHAKPKAKMARNRLEESQKKQELTWTSLKYKPNTIMRFEIIQTSIFISSVCLFLLLVVVFLVPLNLSWVLVWTGSARKTTKILWLYLWPNQSGKQWKYQDTIIKIHPTAILSTKKNSNNKTIANVALKGAKSEAHWQSF